MEYKYAVGWVDGTNPVSDFRGTRGLAFKEAASLAASMAGKSVVSGDFGFKVFSDLPNGELWDAVWVDPYTHAVKYDSMFDELPQKSEVKYIYTAVRNAIAQQ